MLYLGLDNYFFLSESSVDNELPLLYSFDIMQLTQNNLNKRSSNKKVSQRHMKTLLKQLVDHVSKLFIENKKPDSWI